MTKLYKILVLASLLKLLVACGNSPFFDDEFTESGEQMGLGADFSLSLSNITIRTQWLNGPAIMEESKLLITLFNQDGKLLSSAQSESLDFRIKLWMPNMGHGSYPVSIKKISSGVFEAKELFFTMPGFWDIHFQLFEDGILKEEVLWGLTL